MKAIPIINKTREYLNYLEDHILNVEKAWKEVEEKCKDMRFIYDDVFYHNLRAEVESHDLSKLSEHEFVQYRKSFYPADGEGKHDMTSAWEHHKTHNPHHWENWTKQTGCVWHPDDWEADCAHMVIDWMAMGYKFDDTAQEFYEANKHKIELPDCAVGFIYEIFHRVYPKIENEPLFPDEVKK